MEKDCPNCGNEIEIEKSKVRKEKKLADRGLISDPSSVSHYLYTQDCPKCNFENSSKFFAMTFNPKKGEKREEALDFCLDKDRGMGEFIGLGWGEKLSQQGEVPENGPDAIEKIRDIEDWSSGKGKAPQAVKEFILWMEPGDILYAYSTYEKSRGTYFQIKIKGEYKFVDNLDCSEEMKEEYRKHDQYHIRRAEWKEVSLEQLPGAIQTRVPPRGTIQKAKFDDKGTASYLMDLFRNPSKYKGFEKSDLKDIEAKIRDKDPEKITDALQDDELEDIVVSYLQRVEDAILMKSTSYSSQPAVECVLRKSRAGSPKIIFVQVKYDSSLDPELYERYGNSENEELFVFNGGDETEISHAELIKNQHIKEYMVNYVGELPESVLHRFHYMF